MVITARSVGSRLGRSVFIPQNVTLCAPQSGISLVQVSVFFGSVARGTACAQNATTPDSQRADVMANGQRHRLEEERVSWRKLRPADLKRSETITNQWVASRAGWTPYDGMRVTGWPVGTFLRGKRVMWQGELTTPSTGEPVRFLATLKA